MPRLLERWGGEGFYDTSSPRWEWAVQRRCRGVGARVHINASFIVASAARMLGAELFLLAVGVTPRTIEQYNRGRPPLHIEPSDSPPVRSVFCSIERSVLRGAGRPVHVIDTREALHHCLARGARACKAFVQRRGRLGMDAVCDGVRLDEVVRLPQHPLAQCGGT